MLQALYQHISCLKLAVAFAILRSKPPEQSARTYTENIQAHYLSSQSLLQDQYHRAKVQILHLQQKLAESSFLQVTQTSGKVDGVISSLPESSSSKSYSSQPKARDERSYLTSTNNQLFGKFDVFFGQEKMAKADDSLLPSHGVGHDCKDVSMLENYKFMHSMIALQGLARKESGMENDYLLEAAVTHVHTLRSVIDRDVMILSETCMCKGAESVMMLTDNVAQIVDQPEFMQEVCLLVECIINKLVQSSSFGQSQVHRQKRALMNMILVFMKGKMLPLLCSILESLVESLETFCQKLKTSQLRREAVDPDFFENGYFVGHCLELTMKMWSKSCPIHTSMLQEIQAKLDRALMQIAHSFPLVAQALLRITSLIEAILQNR